MPQAVAVRETRLATSGIETSRSCDISSRKGARVVPLEVAANDPRQAAPISAQGRPRDEETLMRRCYDRNGDDLHRPDGYMSHVRPELARGKSFRGNER